MRLRILVGDVDISVSGIEYTPRQVTKLLNRAAEVAHEQPVIAEDEERPPAGFGLYTEIDPER